MVSKSILGDIMIKIFLNFIERAKNQINDFIFMFTHILEPGKPQSGKLQKNSLQNWKTRALKMICFYLIVDIHQKKCSDFWKVKK